MSLRPRDPREGTPMDDLSKRIRDASPYANKSLPDSAEMLLRELVEGRRVPREDPGIAASSRRRVTVPLLSVAGAMLIVLLVVLVVAIDRPVAVAATPDPLAVHGTSWTLPALQKEVGMAGTDGTPGTTKLGARYEGWYLQVDEGAEHGLIQPQRVVSEVDADGSGSGTTRVVASDPVAPDGRVIVPVPPGGSPSGTVLSETVWTADEYAVAFPTLPPDTADAMREYLLDHLRRQGAELPEPVAGGDYLVAAVTLLQTWTLDEKAQRALLEVLLDAPGLRVAGGATDRAGRPGVVLDVAPGALGNPAFRQRLVIDPTHWRVLAVESAVVDGIPEHQVPAGAVTSYTLWR